MVQLSVLKINKKINEITPGINSCSDYSKVAQYKVKIQNSIICLYNSNEQVECEIKNMIPCTLASSKMKYLGFNLTKYAHHVYENYKTAKKYQRTK